MKLDDKYSVKIVVLEEFNDGSTGNVYDDFAQFTREKPESGYRFGFCVVNTETGIVPRDCNDWNDSMDEAIADWEWNALHYYD